MVEEGKALADKPHIVISTPGRLADHINTGTNFSLKKLRFLVTSFMEYVNLATISFRSSSLFSESCSRFGQLQSENLCT